MKILFLASGRQVPATRYRVLPYVSRLRALGHECRVAMSCPPKYTGFWWLGNRLSEVPRTIFRLYDLCEAHWRGYDVVVLERELFSSSFVLMDRLFRKAAPAMVLDLDDATFLLHPQKFDTLVGMCDAVIVGNALLSERVEPLNPHVVLIPTAIDLSRFTQKQTQKVTGRRLVVGWTGTAANLPQLKLLEKPLQRLSREFSFELQIIAERPPLNFDVGELPVRFVPWCEETEISDLQQFDVGIMPLEDTQWTRYKCGLKILQYMALGIPSVASPIGVNRQIIEHARNGLLAETSEQWSTALRRLLGDEEFRLSLGSAGRQTVEEGYSVDKLVQTMLGVLTGAVTRSHRRRLG